MGEAAVPSRVTWRAWRDARLASVSARLDRTRGGRAVLELVRGSLTVLHHLFQEEIFERASALSFGTIAALVPLLALSVAIAGTVGHSWLRSHVQEFVTAFLAPGVRRSSMQYLEELFDRAANGAVGSVSGLALAYSVVMLLRQVDDIINRIWGVHEPRRFAVRLAIYIALTLATPIFLGLSVGATTLLRTEILKVDFPFSGLLLGVGPLLATVMGLDLLYQMVPNVKVLRRAAFAGALIAGVVWEAAKHGYAYYTDHFMRVGAVYGSLAAVPLLLLWIYLSWVILLFGARLAYAVQNAGSWGADVLPQDHATRTRLVARTMLAVAVAQMADRAAPSVHTLARDTGLPTEVVGESIRRLIAAGLVIEDGAGGLRPARPLKQIALPEVVKASGSSAEGTSALIGGDPSSRALDELFARSEQSARDALQAFDLEALARPLAEGVGRNRAG